MLDGWATWIVYVGEMNYGRHKRGGVLTLNGISSLSTGEEEVEVGR